MQFLELFKKKKGGELIKQYHNGHVLAYALLATGLLGVDKKSLEIMRLAVSNKMLKRLRKQYSRFICNFVNANKNHESVCEKEAVSNGKIWICWFQGIENAPSVVKKCVDSIRKSMPEREVVLITDENWNKYVQFPPYILEKVRNGVISKTHFSDLLRLELLIKYGGTWMDTTIFCTSKCPSYMMEADLFLFQNLKPGLDGQATRISNWFITAKKENCILKLTRDLLYEYWKKQNSLIDYYIFHDMFELAIEAYPDEWQKVPPVSNSTSHILLLRLFDKYDEELWGVIKGQTSIHKLTYKFSKEQEMITGTYYDTLFKQEQLW